MSLQQFIFAASNTLTARSMEKLVCAQMYSSTLQRCKSIIRRCLSSHCHPHVELEFQEIC